MFVPTRYQYTLKFVRSLVAGRMRTPLYSLCAAVIAARRAVPTYLAPLAERPVTQPHLLGADRYTDPSRPHEEANITARHLHMHSLLPRDWKVTISERHCHPLNTVSYEQHELRMVLLLGLQWKQAGEVGYLVDVGANCGVYSILLASLGHSCLAIDPLPTCVDEIRWGIQRNNFKGRIRVLQRAISDRPEPIVVPETKCTPYFQLGSRQDTAEQRSARARGIFLDGSDRRAWFGKDGRQSRTANSSASRFVDLKPLSSSKTPRITMLKIDTEGHEIRVLASAEPLLRRRIVRYMLWELTPNKWHVANTSPAAGLSLLRSLFQDSSYETVTFMEPGRRRAACRVPGVCAERGVLTEGLKRRLPLKHFDASNLMQVFDVAAYANATLAAGDSYAVNLLSVAVANDAVVM